MRAIGRLAAITTLIAPAFASAATLLDTLDFLSTFLNSAIGLFITIAILAFFWSLIRYMVSSGSDEKQKMVRTMFRGVAAIFVMTSIWGIVRLLQNTFQVTSTDPVVPGGVKVDTSYYKSY